MKAKTRAYILVGIIALVMFAAIITVVVSVFGNPVVSKEDVAGVADIYETCYNGENFYIVMRMWQYDIYTAPITAEQFVKIKANRRTEVYMTGEKIVYRDGTVKLTVKSVEV